MENSLNNLMLNIKAIFIATPTTSGDRDKETKWRTLIRMHSNERLGKTGDITFSTSFSIWQNYVDHQKIDNGVGPRLHEDAFNIFKGDGEEAARRRDEFLNATANWPYPIERLEVHKERCALFLQRKAVIEHVLRQILATDAPYFEVRKKPERRLLMPFHSAAEEEDVQNNDNISHYRAALIGQTLRRLLRYSEWVLLEGEQGEDNGALVVQVQTVSAKGADSTTVASGKVATIKCGIVCDPATGKMTKLETHEYLKLRSNDMQLMAMHKYGIRVKDDPRFCDLIKRLGTAAVAVDLLEGKHSSPVQIIRNGQGSTKGASFILYNSARLETLLRNFDARVQSSQYEALPPLDTVDLTLLRENEEWQLIYGFILTFPQLIERCVEHIENGSCGTHAIVRYLSGLVAVFSIYYHRIRILTEKRDHLMPYVYARIYLLKALREILVRTLALLNIEPLSFM